MVIILVLSSTIGLFYYLRVVVAIYQPAPVEAPRGAVASPLEVSWGGSLVLGALTILLLWWGVYPAPLIHWIQIAGGSRPWP